jgi:hypothetical protein
MWTWCGKMGLGMEAKTRWQIEIAYIPHVHVFEFLQGEQGDMQIAVKWNISKKLSPQQHVKKSTIKKHFGHTWYGFKIDKTFPMVNVSSYRVSRFCVF